MEHNEQQASLQDEVVSCFTGFLSSFSADTTLSSAFDAPPLVYVEQVCRRACPEVKVDTRRP